MLSLNVQEPEKRSPREDGALELQETYFTTQGEGPYVGSPAIFVRTAGCTLQCGLCDTDYTSRRKLYTVQRLMEEVQKLTPSKLYKPLVVITGGEPFRQDCGQVVGALVISGYRVQFETNGTVYDPSMEDWYQSPMVTIVCSPKTPKLHEKLKPHISALKYVLKAGQVDIDGLPTSSLLQGVRPCRPWDEFSGIVYVQPVDEDDAVLNAANLQATLQSCKEFGWTLCLQTHKMIGLP